MAKPPSFINESTMQTVINIHAAHDVRPVTSTMGNPHEGNTQLHDDHNKSAGVNKPIYMGRDIANRAATASTPFHSHNQFSALSTATDDDQSDNPLIEQQLRRYRRTKRKLASSSSPDNTLQQQQSKASRKRAVYDRSSDKAAGIAAADKLVRKAVYCIDNVDVSFSVEDIVQYASNNGITVMSCFEAKPRLRRSDNCTNDRKAFRLCINNDQRDKLLDSFNWPDSVVVSEWFFKSQQLAKRSRDAPDDERLRAESSFHYGHLELESAVQETMGTDC